MHTITVMAHEDGATLSTLKKYREIIRERVAAHHSRVVDSRGNALLVEFTGSGEAVE